MVLSINGESTTKLKKSVQMFGRFLLINAIILLRKLTSFSLEFHYKHILITPDSDFELNKYNILMMTVIIKGLLWLILERFCCKYYHSQLSTRLVMVKLATIIGKQLYTKTICQWIFSNLFYWLVDMYGNISVIRLCIVQAFDD